MDQPQPMLKKGSPLPIIIVGVVMAALGFFGGMLFQKNQDSLAKLSGTALQAKLQKLGLGSTNPGGFGSNTNRARNGNFNGFGGPRNGGGFVTGSIVSVDSQSLTVKETNGSTKTVYYTGATTVQKTVTGAAADLVVGENVVTSGTANTDGSVAATSIQIRPAGETSAQPGGAGEPPIQ